jgi:predicted RNA-binding protein with PIN domain
VARLRPALEAAFAVARAGLEANPPVAPPAALRPFLSFRRLSGRALDRAAKVLDDDEAFRERVRDAVEPDDVGDAGWLFLDRPDGWQERLDELLGEAVRDAETAGSAEEVARLTRELARAVEERDEAMEAARHARTEQDRAARGLADARSGREAADEQVAALTAQVAELRDERAAAVRDLKALEVRANARLDELRRAQEDLAAARLEVAALEDALSGDVDTDAARTLAQDQAHGEAPPAPVAEQTPVGSGPALDRDALAALVARAAEAAALLSSSLAEAAELVRPADDVDEAESVADDEPAAASAPSPAPVDDQARPARREPVGLPVGMFDDGPDAVMHLLRHPGSTLAVDGYNVSLKGWPTLALSAQRKRLVDALDSLAARTGCSVVVVFDGADIGSGLPGESRPRGVQVRFTAPGVEADDELLALLEALPVDRPVTVASSDRRVADGARRRGASVIGSEQLLGVLNP